MEINKVYQNGFMTIELVSLVTTDLETLSNVAIVRRLNKDKQTIDFVVVCNFRVNNSKCDWAFAFQYDIPTLELATELLVGKFTNSLKSL